MIPTVGRIVHYTNLGDRDGRFPPEAQAALITKVSKKDLVPAGLHSPEESAFDVSLRVFYEEGEFIMKKVPFTSAHSGTEEARGKWSWPPKV